MLRQASPQHIHDHFDAQCTYCKTTRGDQTKTNNNLSGLRNWRPTREEKRQPALQLAKNAMQLAKSGLRDWRPTQEEKRQPAKSGSHKWKPTGMTS